jgi:5'-deoxynucleotidase YfbR-like HD superfamily hydrolase
MKDLQTSFQQEIEKEKKKTSEEITSLFEEKFKNQQNDFHEQLKAFTMEKEKAQNIVKELKERLEKEGVERMKIITEVRSNVSLSILFFSL